MQWTNIAASAAFCAVLALPAVCAAQDSRPIEVNLSQMTMGYNYFNRPGADLNLHDADVAACAAEAARTISVDEQIHTDANQGLMGALLGNYMQSAAHRGAAAAGLENCMVVRGWRVVKVPDDEGKLLAKLPAAELTARMTPWIGAVEPHGQIVRLWGNDAANAAVKRYSLRPNHINDGQLSLTEATSDNLHQFAPYVHPVETARGTLDAKWPKKPLTSDQLVTSPEGSAIILIQIKGLSFRNGNALYFNRIGTADNIYPSRTDHGPDVILISKYVEFAHKEGDMFALAVPPGRWRVKGLGIGTLNVVNFCLGSPSFPVEAGEVVYAGSFDLGGNLGPNLDLAPAKTWLAGHPQAETVRTAVYTNGSRGVCGNNAIYALEIPGASFEPDYACGSAVKSLPAPATTQSAPAPETLVPSSSPAAGPAPSASVVSSAHN